MGRYTWILLTVVKLLGDDLLTSSSSEEGKVTALYLGCLMTDMTVDICDEIPSAHHSFTIDQGPEFQDLKKVLKVSTFFKFMYQLLTAH